MIKVIFWDFDGVLINSNEIRDLGFQKVLGVDYPDDEVNALLKFHWENGGLSRYVKFRYFFEKIRKESVSDEKILELSEKFSRIMIENLVNPLLLIDETITFVRQNKDKYSMHITSGSDQNELRILCKSLGIENDFISIHGSPIPKPKLVQELINKNKYDINSCVLIGDSFNDYQAALSNGIKFQAYNNPSLQTLSNCDFPILIN